MGERVMTIANSCIRYKMLNIVALKGFKGEKEKGKVRKTKTRKRWKEKGKRMKAQALIKIDKVRIR